MAADHLLLFGADLSLDPVRHGALDVNASNTMAELTATRQSYCSPESFAGEQNHAGGLVDYLGALPVLQESSVGTSVCPTTPSQGSDDSVSICDDNVSTQLTLFDNGAGIESIGTDQNKIAKPFGENVNAFYSNALSFKLSLENLYRQCQDLQTQRKPEIKNGLVSKPHLFVDGRLEDVTKDRNASHADFSSLLVPCQAIVPRALPLARKASLTRFLEMRKKRSIAPYVAKGSMQTHTIHQGLHHLNGSTPRMCFDEYWGDASAKNIQGCGSWFLHGDNVEIKCEHRFNNLTRNTKIDLESESST